MREKYTVYSKKIEKFKEEIYFYCDYNQELEVLFPAFVNLWPENTGEKRCLSGKDLAIITSDILQELVNRRILVVIAKKEEFQNPYTLYKIDKHENLMKYNSLIERKMELIQMVNAYKKQK